MSEAARTLQAKPLHLKRVLSLWDLIFYGLVLIQPTAPIPLFGVAQKLSNGHTVTVILVAMLAMVVTAVSYGRMAAVYPSAGSAYTYVGRAINPHIGFLVGWAMLLDYILQPLLNVVWISAALHSRYIHSVPYALTALAVIAFMTALNLNGIKTSARANKLLILAMCALLSCFFYLAIRYLFHMSQWAGIFSTEPFYDPKTFDPHLIWGATSFAALTYIGFDGITTLSEDVKNPRRNVLLATVLVCVFTGILSGVEVPWASGCGPTGILSRIWKQPSWTFAAG